MTVVFTASCPEGHEATWHQASGNGYAVHAGDFRVLCATCDPPIPESPAKDMS